MYPAVGRGPEAKPKHQRKVFVFTSILVSQFQRSTSQVCFNCTCTCQEDLINYFQVLIARQGGILSKVYHSMTRMLHVVSKLY